jgi:cytochrome c-type biogenesis protein CcmH
MLTLRNTVRRNIIALFLLSILALSGLVAEELDPAIQAQANSIAQSVLSPFCPGRALSECPSGEANKLKHEIYQLLKDGGTPEQVKDYLYQTYGEEIRAVPGSSGFELLAWVGPVLFVVLGVLILITWIVRQRQKEN